MKGIKADFDDMFSSHRRKSKFNLGIGKLCPAAYFYE